MTEVANPEDVRPGDLLRSKSCWFIATKRAYESTPGVICTRRVDGGPIGIIRWSLDNVQINGESFISAYTRYPD